MGHSIGRALKRFAVMLGLSAAFASHGDEGVLGVYPFTDHGSMHFRSQPLLDYLRQNNANLRLDVADSYDELMQRALNHEYAVLQVPAHFGLYLQRCCNYRIVAGWQGSVSALWLALDDAVPLAPGAVRPQTLSAASLLSFSTMAITGSCASQFTHQGRLHMVMPSGTHERALQALLRGKVDGAIVSGTTLHALKPDLRKRLRVVKEVSGLPGDVILVQIKTPSPAWQGALENDFPNSSYATELQRRWFRPQGIISVAELQLRPARVHSEPVAGCLRTASDSTQSAPVESRQ